MSEQFNYALPVAEITIIKRDFDLMRKLSLAMKPELQFQLIPYTALFCYEVIEYLNNQGQHIELEQTSRFSIKDVRQKAKFFDLSINKLLNSIKNIDKAQNEYFINLMRFPCLGRWNVHTNIGIFFDDEKNIISNTHYAYYLFQKDKTMSRSDFAINGELDNQEIYAFSYDLGRIIGSITSALSITSDFIVSDIFIDNISLHSQDFNTNRCCNYNEDYKTLRLFLLHILSSIGYLLYILKKVIIRDNGLLLRLEYITYHYALVRLEKIYKFHSINITSSVDPNLMKMFQKINYKTELKNSEFRNCMMHFGLRDKTGSSLIEEKNFNLSIPFCGLIESQFKMTYNEYKTLLEKELAKIYDNIKEYLGFDLLLNESS